MSRPDSSDYDKEWLPFLDDVCCELGPLPGADVSHRVDRFGRYHQGVAGVVRCRRLAVDRALERSFEDMDDLFARMLVSDERSLRSNFDEVLDGLTSGDA